MPAASAFADLLDARMAVQARQVPAGGWQICTQPVGAAAMPWWPGAALFAKRQPRPEREPFEAPRDPEKTGKTTRADRPAQPETVVTPPRRARDLTPAQRDALAVLSEAAGGGLDAAFTGDELKRAFRRAARRTHPDAHPDASPEQRRALNERFSTARRAFTLLRSLV